MATQNDVNRVQQWFESYTSSFVLEDIARQKNIELKKTHSKKVAEEAKKIAQSLGLIEKDLFLCEIIGLLHDVGKFSQYYTYRTFVDSKSENHALLGKNVIEKSNILNSFSNYEKEIILFSVFHHNFKKLPASESKKKIFFTKLLRDADKLDIFRVVTDYYENHHNGDNSGIELDLPISDKISKKVIDDILNHHLVEITDLKTNTDFKILQLGWTFDINFPYTFIMIRKRKYIERICATLPESKEKNIVCKIVNIYIKDKSV